MAQKLLVFGNSGAGKSTLARSLCAQRGLAHLDLDPLAWLPGSPPERAPLQASFEEINRFIVGNERWVIEGCYADLLGLVSSEASELLFLDLPLTECLAHARARPFEPHKYPSKAAQDANLEMLLEWIAAYPEREGPCGFGAHRALFDDFAGRKTCITSREAANAYVLSRA